MVFDCRSKLMTPKEVAALFRVDRKTVVRWAAAGRLPATRTPGGHRRFYEHDVMAFLRSLQDPQPTSGQETDGV